MIENHSIGESNNILILFVYKFYGFSFFNADMDDIFNLFKFQ